MRHLFALALFALPCVALAQSAPSESPAATACLDEVRGHAGRAAVLSMQLAQEGADLRTATARIAALEKQIADAKPATPAAKP